MHGGKILAKPPKMPLNRIQARCRFATFANNGRELHSPLPSHIIYLIKLRANIVGKRQFPGPEFLFSHPPQTFRIPVPFRKPATPARVPASRPTGFCTSANGRYFLHTKRWFIVPAKTRENR